MKFASRLFFATGLLAALLPVAEAQVEGAVPAAWRVATTKFPSPQTTATIAAPSSTTKRWYWVHVDVDPNYEPMVALTVDKASTNKSIQSGTSVLAYGNVISVALSDGAEAGSGSASLLAQRDLDALPSRRLNWRAVAAQRFGNGQVQLKPLTLAMLDTQRDLRIYFDHADKECVGLKAAVILDTQPALDASGTTLVLSPGNSVIVRGKNVHLLFQGTCTATVAAKGFWSLVDGVSKLASD